MEAKRCYDPDNVFSSAIPLPRAVWRWIDRKTHELVDEITSMPGDATASILPRIVATARREVRKFDHFRPSQPERARASQEYWNMTA
jgi:hypothetical protein